MNSFHSHRNKVLFFAASPQGKEKSLHNNGYLTLIITYLLSMIYKAQKTRKFHPIDFERKWDKWADIRPYLANIKPIWANFKAKMGYLK